MRERPASELLAREGEGSSRARGGIALLARCTTRKVKQNERDWLRGCSGLAGPKRINQHQACQWGPPQGSGLVFLPPNASFTCGFHSPPLCLLGRQPFTPAVRNRLLFAAAQGNTSLPAWHCRRCAAVRWVRCAVRLGAAPGGWRRLWSVRSSPLHSGHRR